MSPASRSADLGRRSSVPCRGVSQTNAALSPCGAVVSNNSLLSYQTRVVEVAASLRAPTPRCRNRQRDIRRTRRRPGGQRPTGAACGVARTGHCLGARHEVSPNGKPDDSRPGPRGRFERGLNRTRHPARKWKPDLTAQPPAGRIGPSHLAVTFRLCQVWKLPRRVLTTRCPMWTTPPQGD
jgi:hypothetical protein